jgi:hypothetical protein
MLMIISMYRLLVISKLPTRDHEPLNELNDLVLRKLSVANAPIAITIILNPNEVRILMIFPSCSEKSEAHLTLRHVIHRHGHTVCERHPTAKQGMST